MQNVITNTLLRVVVEIPNLGTFYFSEFQGFNDQAQRYEYRDAQTGLGVEVPNYTKLDEMRLSKPIQLPLNTGDPSGNNNDDRILIDHYLSYRKNLMSQPKKVISVTTETQPLVTFYDAIFSGMSGFEVSGTAVAASNFSLSFLATDFKRS